MYETLKNLSTQIGMTRNIELKKEDTCELYDLIKEIIQCSTEVRRQGLLSIENYETKYFLLKKGLKLVCSGTDPVVIEQVMSKLIISGNYKGKELVARLIIMDGINGIQHGENPQRLHDVLTSWLGEEFSIEYEEYMGDLELLSRIEKIRERLFNGN